MNNFIAVLLTDLAEITSGKPAPHSTATMSLSYALTTVAMLGYLVFRDFDLAAKGKLEAKPQPKSLFRYGLSHALYWLFPLAISAVLGALLTWQFQFEDASKFSGNMIFNTATLAGVVFPIYQRIVR